MILDVDPDSIRDRIRELLEAKLAGKADAVVWPATTQDLPAQAALVSPPDNPIAGLFVIWPPVLVPW